MVDYTTEGFLISSSDYLTVTEDEAKDGITFDASGIEKFKDQVIFSYKWDFGDSIKSTQINPFHRYSEEDTFDISLIAISEEGCKDTVVHKMVVFPSPIAGFTMNDSAQCFDRNQYEFTNKTKIS